MISLSRDDVGAAFGRIDDIKIAEIIATGATPEELAEARIWLDADDQLGKETHRLPSGRVAQVIDVLRSGETEWEEAERP